jgi:two-component sensor histidine kinase
MLWRERYDLPSRFAGWLPPLVTEILVGLSMIALAIGLRLFIELFFHDVVVFALIFPAVVGATLLAGARSGAIVVVGCQLLAWYVLLPVKNSFRFETWGNVVSLFLTTSAQLLLLWSVSSYRKASRSAADTERQRSEALAVALRELDHRTKNNFQMAAALLHLHSSRSTHPEVRNELAAAASRITSIAAIHEHLSAGRSDLSRVNLRDYLEEICEHIRAGLADGHVRISTDIEELETSADHALHLGLIVNELVTNALKHAFTEEGGRIHVVARAEGGMLLLRVSDDGTGTMSSKIQQRAGIGTKLMDMLANAIDGKISRRSGPGLIVEVRAPLNSADGCSISVDGGAPSVDAERPQNLSPKPQAI